MLLVFLPYKDWRFWGLLILFFGCLIAAVWNFLFMIIKPKVSHEELLEAFDDWKSIREVYLSLSGASENQIIQALQFIWYCKEVSKLEFRERLLQSRWKTETPEEQRQRGNGPRERQYRRISGTSQEAT